MPNVIMLFDLLIKQIKKRLNLNLINRGVERVNSPRWRSKAQFEKSQSYKRDVFLIGPTLINELIWKRDDPHHISSVYNYC